MKIIDSFSGEYEFLSNFYDHEIFYDGRWWARNENAYQAAKTDDEMIKSAIWMATASKSKRIGKSIKLLRPNMNAIYDADNPCKGNKMETANITIRKEITQDELWKINAKHDTWLHDNTKGERACFDRALLYGLNLSNMNLSYATFIDSNIAKCNMQDSIMIETNFSNSRLSDINARYAIFDSANFTRANIIDTNLSGADFSNAIFNKVLLGNVNFAYANLTNANLILAGYDSRGYLFYAYQNPDGVVEVRAGCRRYYGLEEARNHWNTRHPHNKVLTEEIMCNLDKIERVAKVRGWIE